MQIHELNSFVGTLSSTDYLAIDDGNTTTKVPATSLGVSTAMTQAEAEAGTITDLRVISPSVFKSAVLAIAKTITDKWLPQSVVHIVEVGTSGDWAYRKWSDGTAECWGAFSGTVSSWTQWGGTYYSALIAKKTFPSSLFVDTPTCTATLQQSSGDAWLALNGAVTKDETTAFYLMRGTSGGNTSYTLGIKAIGRWK